MDDDTCTCPTRDIVCRQCSGSGQQTRTHYTPRACPKTTRVRSHNPDCPIHGTDRRTTDV